MPAAARRTLSIDERSAAMTRTSAPGQDLRVSSSARRQASGARPMPMTDMPADASCFVASMPIPEDAPVMTQTLLDAPGMSVCPLIFGFLRDPPGHSGSLSPGGMIDGPAGRVVKKMSKFGKKSLVI